MSSILFFKCVSFSCVLVLVSRVLCFIFSLCRGRFQVSHPWLFSAAAPSWGRAECTLIVSCPSTCGVSGRMGYLCSCAGFRVLRFIFSFTRWSRRSVALAVIERWAPMVKNRIPVYIFCPSACGNTDQVICRYGRVSTLVRIVGNCDLVVSMVRFGMPDPHSW